MVGLGHAYERRMLGLFFLHYNVKDYKVQFEIMMRLLCNCSKLVVQHTEICQILPKVQGNSVLVPWRHLCSTS
jgi:hypothetical protein